MKKIFLAWLNGVKIAIKLLQFYLVYLVLSIPFYISSCLMEDIVVYPLKGNIDILDVVFLIVCFLLQPFILWWASELTGLLEK